MRQMVLYIMNGSAERITREAFGEEFRKTGTSTSISETIQHQTEVWALRYQVAYFSEHVCSAVLIDSDVVHFTELQARLREAIFDRLAWKSRPMLLAAKALLFRRRNEFAVDEQGRSRIGMKRI